MDKAMIHCVGVLTVQAVCGRQCVGVRTGGVWEYVQVVCGNTYRWCVGVHRA